MIVLVECNNDTALARALGVQQRNLYHEFCKGNVMNGLRKAASEATGLIDADPNGGNPPAELSKYKEEQSAHGLRLFVHNQEPHKRVIEIYPRLEDWLVARAAACGLNLADYMLPQTARDIYRVPRLDSKPGFQRFLEDLLKSDNGMKTLQAWLSP